MEDFLLFFLTGMLGTEFLDKIIKNKNPIPSIYFLFSLCLTTTFFLFFVFMTIVDFIHTKNFIPNFTSSIKAALIVSPLFSLGLYAAVKIKDK